MGDPYRHEATETFPPTKAGDPSSDSRHGLHTGTFVAILDAMSAQTVQPAKHRRIAPHSAWRQVAMVLVLGVLIHQFLMTTPMHEHVMPPLTAMQQTSGSAQSDMPGSLPSVHGCSAIEACLNREAFFSLLLSLLIVTATIPLLVVFRVSASDCRWSARRHRAFLQVFLC